MKKIVAILIITLMLFVIVANAETVSLHSFSDDELTKLYDDLKEEMYGRGILRRGVLSKGTYVVGRDIAAGSYEVVAGDDYCDYYIFQDEELYEEFRDLSSKIDLRTGHDAVFDDETIKLDLYDGQVLYIIAYSMQLSEVHSGLMP